MDFSGDLQAEVMAIVWKLGEAKVEDVRTAHKKGLAYNTFQTVMNRLFERGLLKRRLRGNAFVYSARYEEADLLTRSIGDRLRRASPHARRKALHDLVGELEPHDLDELSRYANRIKRDRRGT
ncbi:MAG: BlaI/MecI/CopY family transcriptional regulator [Thermoleophilaceae bacterium]|nr:BlaI/MecI/CopY family transcriptional regulator [Thermoleophilaceae bacterium]